MKKQLPMFKLEYGYVRIVKSRFPERIRGAAHALRLSIAKWEFIVKRKRAGKEIKGDGLGATCALCMYHFKCKGCPVMEETGKSQCIDTPFTYWGDAKSLETAKAELDFLKSLKP